MITGPMMFSIIVYASGVLWISYAILREIARPWQVSEPRGAFSPGALRGHWILGSSGQKPVARMANTAPLHWWASVLTWNLDSERAVTTPTLFPGARWSALGLLWGSLWTPPLLLPTWSFRVGSTYLQTLLSLSLETSLLLLLSHFSCVRLCATPSLGFSKAPLIPTFIMSFEMRKTSSVFLGH